MRNLQKKKDLVLTIKGLSKHIDILAIEKFEFQTEYELLRFVKGFQFADKKIVAITWSCWDRKNNALFYAKDFIK